MHTGETDLVSNWVVEAAKCHFILLWLVGWWLLLIFDPVLDP